MVVESFVIGVILLVYSGCLCIVVVVFVVKFGVYTVEGPWWKVTFKWGFPDVIHFLL